jgi:hypothetical protein
MEHGTRVTRKSTGKTGQVVGQVIGSHAYVRYDEGGGCNVPVDDLAPEDKSWPPAGLEHKTPRVDTK